MRLIAYSLFLLFFHSCVNKDTKQEAFLPDYFCELINEVHKRSQFKFEHSSNEIILLDKFTHIYLARSNSFKEFQVRIIDSQFICNDLKFKVIKSEKFDKKEYDYLTFISLRFDSTNHNQVVLSRSIRELNPQDWQPGEDYTTGENFYFRKIRGFWVLDSLIHDIAL